MIKQIFLEDIPKHGSQFDWINSIGIKVNFIYGSIEGIVEIIKYTTKDKMLSIRYCDKEFKIYVSGFKNCSFGELLKIKTIDYKYNINDIINDYKILDKIRIKRGKKTEKGYKYKCLKCSYEGEIFEYMLSSGASCPVCCNRIVVKGINDIATTNPEYIKYFVNIEDAYKNSKGANKNVKLKCPDCRYEKRMTLNSLTNTGFHCSKCSDGLSYAEKFIFSLLEQINTKFKNHKYFKWSDKKQYDFSISDINTIIETHGLQHYKDSFNRIKSNKKIRSLEEEQQNDKLKEKLATENNIKHYIVLDCRRSELDWIKNSVMESKLPKLLNFKEDDISWLKCHEFALSSLMKKACELWNSGVKSTSDISKVFNISQGSIIRYLNNGAKCGLCDYTNCKSKCRVAVYNSNNIKLGEFKSVNELAKKSLEIFGEKFSTGAISIANKNNKIHKGYFFKYIKEDKTA